MREILLRGKRIDNGKWVEGYYFCSRNPHRESIHKIHPLDSDWSYEINPETVGQYTGLTDKNGKKIFEGDIIQNVDGFVFGSQYKAVVKMGNEKDGTYMGCYFAESSLIEIDAYDFGYCEVIGNATDNPELLEAEE